MVKMIGKRGASKKRVSRSMLSAAAAGDNSMVRIAVTTEQTAHTNETIRGGTPQNMRTAPRKRLNVTTPRAMTRIQNG
jgi:type II secretory pathway predicted ATPase ExeA